MRSRLPLGRLFLLSTCVMLMVVLAGCSGYRAKKRLESTNSLLGELETLNAQVHAPDDIQRVRQLVDQANSQLDADASTAFELASQARTLAEQSIDRVRPLQANALWDEANSEIEVLDANGAAALYPDQYARIRDFRSAGIDARGQADFPALINISTNIKLEAGNILNTLKREAEGAFIDAESKFTDLKREGGNNYAPEMVIAVQDLMDRADRAMNQSRDYVLARTEFRNARDQAERAITIVYERKGEEIIGRIETLLASALDEGAREYLPREYDLVSEVLAGILVDFESREFSRVLQGGADLEPRAQVLVVDTKRQASQARIRTIQSDINTLVEGGAREYLPGRVERLEELLAGARQLLAQNTEDAFDNIKEISLDAAEESDKIHRAFQELASEAIRVAANQLDSANAVYSQLPSIFQPLADAPADLAPFAEGRDARRIQLGGELVGAREALQVADRRMRDRAYQGAILLANEQALAANSILGEIYRLVAGSSVVELASLISLYEREGARLYAPAELDRSTRDLDRVKNAINEGEYLLATELAGAARSNVELMAQRISGRAVVDIREARSVLNSITSDKTERYSGDALVRVRQLIEEAEAQLQAEGLKLAVELANEATRTARQAEDHANRMAATDAMAEAQNAIARAERAGAGNYAGREMESSRSLLESARSLFNNGDFVSSEAQALASIERGTQALFKNVTDAESAIADAKSVDGWQYNNAALSRASARAREARRAIEGGEFDRARGLASEAQSEATSVARGARTANYRAARNRLFANLEEGRQQGINYFQVEDAVAVRRRIAEIDNEWSQDNYDFVMSELTKLEGNLRNTLETTDAIVETVARQQGVRLDRLVDAGATSFGANLVASARSNLHYATIDYRNGLYKEAHSALDRAIKDVDELERRFFHQNFVAEVQDLFTRYGDAQQSFGVVLRMSPAELKTLAFGSYSRGNMIAISDKYTPFEFRNELERLYSEALDMEVPQGFEAVAQQVVGALNEGRLASIHFEKLVILNEVSNEEAERLIDAAYAGINLSNRMVSDLQRQFFRDEVEFRLVGTGSAR